MDSPLIVYDDLTTLANEGGYANTPALTDLSAVFLLSACLVMQQRWLWETPLNKISDATWENIVEMLDQAQADLMNNWQVGSIIASISTQTPENCLKLDGSSVLVADYPELSALVPSGWISGGNINLPDMTESGVFGTDIDANIGAFRGENDVQLTEPEMPSHTHIQNPHTHGYSNVIASSALGGEIPATASIVSPSAGTTSPTAATNQSAGGDTPHNNVQRSLQVNYFIVAR